MPVLHSPPSPTSERWTGPQPVVGASCIVVGLVLLLGLRLVGRSERSAAVWTTSNRGQALVAGIVAIVVGVVLLLGGGQ